MGLDVRLVCAYGVKVIKESVGRPVTRYNEVTGEPFTKIERSDEWRVADRPSIIVGNDTIESEHFHGCETMGVGVIGIELIYGDSHRSGSKDYFEEVPELIDAQRVHVRDLLLSFGCVVRPKLYVGLIVSA